MTESTTPPSRVDMQALATGERFIGPDGSRYEVVTAASEHERGWVDVRNLSIPDDEAAAMMAAGAVGWEVNPETGERVALDPRDGFFAYSYPTPVERVPAEHPPITVAEVDADEL
ncbi:hypothetical protein ACFW0V_30980 [Micromonospora parva]|uniref:hypothetical protein n=1 Tax=Micromonospora parva TaxID=1464048 RepID=UPI003671EB0D